MTAYLQTPGQASINFGLGTLNAARPKGLFFVRFRRPASVTSDITQGNDFGFVVKSVDQPKITAKTEELTQYNKKRHVHTGYEVSPITITLVDTLKGTARTLWQSYLKYHYADFNHTESKDWYADQISNTMYGAKTGYGYQVPQGSSEADESARYYFDTIEIIQVYAGTFTKSILVNPRIMSFDPDELDYEQMGPSTFKMQVTYETVIYEELKKISSDSELAELFGQAGLKGYELEVESSFPTVFGGLGAIGQEIGAAFQIGNSVSDILGALGATKLQAGIGGVLNKASSAITFGSLFSSNVEGVVSDIGRVANGQSVSGVLQSLNSLEAHLAGTIASAGQIGRVASINAAEYDAVRSQVAAQGTSAAMQSQIVAGVLSANQITGGGNISSGVLNLSDAALGIINATRPRGSQIGKRRPTI